MCLEIILLKLLSHLPGAYESMSLASIEIIKKKFLVVMPYIILLLSEALMAVTLAALRAPMTRLKKKNQWSLFL